MAKKKSSTLNLLYLVGMVLVTVGFCLPLFFYKMGNTIKAGSTTGFNFINFNRDALISTGALLIFVGGCAGVLLSFLKMKSIKLLKLCALAVVCAGVVIFVFKYNNSSLTKAFGKGMLKHAFVGIYMIVIGWVTALVGWLSSK